MTLPTRKTVLVPLSDCPELFSKTDSADSRSSGPFFRVSSSSKTPVSTFPSLLMSQGFDRGSARNEAMLTLRMTANQAARSSGGKGAFLRALDREIALKRGDFEAEILMRDALMDKFFNRDNK